MNQNATIRNNVKYVVANRYLLACTDNGDGYSQLGDKIWNRTLTLPNLTWIITTAEKTDILQSKYVIAECSVPSTGSLHVFKKNDADYMHE